MRKSHAITGAVAASALVTAGLVTPAMAAPRHTGVVGPTDGQNLMIRKAPTTDSAKVGRLRTGQRVTITCQPPAAKNPAKKTPAKKPVPAPAPPAKKTPKLKDVPPKRVAGKLPSDAMVVRQDQPSNGQRRWNDCGPTSVVMAVRLAGRTPQGWPDEARAITLARDSMLPGRAMPKKSTSVRHVRAALTQAGLKSEWTTDTSRIMEAAASGKTVILGGDAQAMRGKYDIQVRRGKKVHHWLVVSGYDPATHRYGVLDPISRTRKVHALDRASIEKFKRGGDDYRMGGIIVG